MIPLIFPNVPQSSLGILKVPQLTPLLGHPSIKNPINSDKKMIPTRVERSGIIKWNTVLMESNLMQMYMVVLRKISSYILVKCLGKKPRKFN